MFSNEVLNLLRCPVTLGRLYEAEAATVARLNERISAGELSNQLGEQITEPLDGALISADGRRGYPVRGGIPTLLADEALDLPPPDSKEAT